MPNDDFYKSKPWLKIRKLALQRDNYLCQECLRNKRFPIPRATTVHHKKPLKDYPELALDLDNLESECDSCHNVFHPEKSKHKKRIDVKGVRVIKI